MQNIFSIALILLICISPIYKCTASNISGFVFSASPEERISGVAISIDGSNSTSYTDNSGQYIINNVPSGTHFITFSAPGYKAQTKTVNLQDGKDAIVSIGLMETFLNLKTVTVNARADSGSNLTKISPAINRLDMKLRPTNSAQDLLRMVPGLFIAQHAGGGKAEQIFLRGFDCDHGTDFAIYVDGLPVNMVSHAHGQGYADLHFVIPETIRQIDVNKGPYNAKMGDFATSGSAELQTANYLDRNVVQLEAGQFNTFRALAMINLLDNKHLFSKNKENAYIATEYRYTDAYFDNPQRFNRLNIYSKYTGMLSASTTMNFSASVFSSHWNASGQIPERLVAEHTLSPFGSVDPTEGGKTSRYNGSIKISHRINEKSSWQQQLYYSRYDFSLFSNFTFFLLDSVHGDEINQLDHRNLAGYNASYQYNGKLFGKHLYSTAGANVRYDNSEVSLIHAEKRNLLDTFVSGRLNQMNSGFYLTELLDLNSKFSMEAAIRMDGFYFSFQNPKDAEHSGTDTRGIISPKLSFFYKPTQDIVFFLKGGSGFHSNDARAVIINKTEHNEMNVLPRALSSDLGVTFKPVSKILINFSLWTLRLESELIYVGDAAVVEDAGPTRRVGADFSLRYELVRNLFLDADINYNHGRLENAHSDSNRIPLAPILTSIAGLTYKAGQGISSSFRYRYLGDRPANESNTLTAKGYFVADAAINYTRKRYQVGISVENIFNTNWREAQFETTSRLRNEKQEVTEVNFTPGTPRFFKSSVSVFF